MSSLYSLPAGHTITATIADGTGYIRQRDGAGRIVTNAAPVIFGPFAFPRDFLTSGDVSVTIAEAAAVLTPATQAVLDAIPTADPGDGVTVWNNAGVLQASEVSADE